VQYYPLKTGKYIIYSVDSIVYVNLGTKKEIKSAIIQEKIDTTEKDNLGRLSFKIIQSTRNSVDTNKWEFLGTYRVTPTIKGVEVIQQNQRFIKLVSPVIQDYKWMGNAYINTTGNPELSYLNNWEYKYQDISSPQKINNIDFKDCINVLQRNDTIGNPTNRNFFSGINYSREIYARNIGLIFKEVHYEVWQPPNGSGSGYFEKGSFGLKFSILRFN
ncbi:MAG: hypothetical protein RL675_409, partial [Bacteroidota bacterium]